MATMNDIAEKLGVSKSTVSKALNNATDISDDMRRKILATAVDLGYVNKRMQKKEKKLCLSLFSGCFNYVNYQRYCLFLLSCVKYCVDNTSYLKLCIVKPL